MCIISVCPKGTLKNSEEVKNFIKKGFDNNKDGSGFMYKRNGEHKITVSKGYFDFNELYFNINNLNLGIDDELVIHHRRSTHGHISKQNCHPYVITNNVEESLKIEVTTIKPCLAHNGVFRNIKDLIDLNKDLSDTYAFATKVMSNKHIMGLFKDDKQMFKLLLSEILYNSKIAVLHPKRDLELLGNFLNQNGYYHSNNGFCEVINDYGGNSYNSFIRCYDHSVKKEENINRNIDNFLKKTIKNNEIDDSLVLDSSHITLTNDNCKHFYYIEKVHYWSVDKDNHYFVVKDISEDVEFQLGHKPNQENEYVTIPTLRLYNSCFYIPKNTDLKQVYIDFRELVSRDCVTGIKTIRALNKMIDKSRNKDGMDRIYYDKFLDYFTKSSLVMYRKHLLNSSPELKERIEGVKMD